MISISMKQDMVVSSTPRMILEFIMGKLHQDTLKLGFLKMLEELTNPNELTVLLTHILIKSIR